MVYHELLGLIALNVIKAIALSTPIQPSPNNTAVVAITPPYPPLSTSFNTNLSENLVTHGRPICTNDVRWQLPGDSGAGSYTAACAGVLIEFADLEPISPMPLRFVSATSAGISRLPVVRTPRRYTYAYYGKSCTIVIAMLSDFYPNTSVLPGSPEGPYQRTITSDWLHVYEAARNLLQGCFSAGPYFGYVTLRRYNLGVFFWATGSAMEQYLPPDPTFEANSSALETE